MRETHTMNQGFTLIEVLMVIAIIGILSVITYEALIMSRYRGEAAKVVNEARQIRGAIQFRYSDATQYPTEEELEAAYPALAGTTTSISNMIDAGVFEGKFTAAPIASIGTGEYVYDNDASDGTTAYDPDDCGSYTNNAYGVNLVLPGAQGTHPEIVGQLDELVDGGDGLSCGSIRTSSAGNTSVLYNIVPDNTLFP